MRKAVVPLYITEDGRASVKASDVLKTPEAQRQLDAVKRVRSSDPQSPPIGPGCCGDEPDCDAREYCAPGVKIPVAPAPMADTTYGCAEHYYGGNCPNCGPGGVPPTDKPVTEGGA